VRVISNLKKERISCEGCNNYSDFITVSVASQLFLVTEGFIANLAKEGSVHLKLSNNNELVVCLKSLLAARESI
jgi:hypothetical protein